jgi:hypothetical protein
MSPTRGTLEEVFPGDSVHTSEEILARARTSLQPGTEHMPTQEQVLLAALKLGIGLYGIESLDVSRTKTPPPSGHDRTVIDAPARSQTQDGQGDRKLQLEI